MGLREERIRRTKLEQLRNQPRSDAPKQGPAPHPILELQRLAGNASVSALLRSINPDAEVSSDARAEHEADRVADAAVAKLGANPGTPVLPSGALSPALRQAIGSVRPDAASLDGVRVRTDATASSRADSINARAFTHGNEISVANGELAPSRSATHLVAHEAAHAALHQSSSGGDLVHAKMRGTKDALVSMGGEARPAKFRVRDVMGARRHWDTIVMSIAAYEELEDKVLAKGTIKPKELASVSTKLRGLLKDAESAALDWRKSNNEDKANDLSEAAHKKVNGTYAKQTSDPREELGKVGRRQAVAMLLPRIRTEMQLLKSGTWQQSLGLSDNKLVQGAVGRTDQGDKNIVQELTYDTPEGPFSGYFKAEKGFNDKPEDHEISTGIRQADPNYGARAVAMSRLDRLFQTNLLARTEFATHEGKLGTVSASATGTKAADLQTVFTDAEKQERGGNVISMEDPTLQRCLNKLQILDAICGQLDRHYANFLIQVDDDYNVTGLTGIDLDMAFGKDMESVDSKTAQRAANYRGMPTQVDVELGQRILALNPNDIRSVLKGLLADGEIEATVKRFTQVQTIVQDLDAKGGLTTSWNQKSAKETRGNKANTFASGMTSYAQQMGSWSYEKIENAIPDAAKEAVQFGHGPLPFDPSLFHRYDHQDPRTRETVGKIVNFIISKTVLPLHWSGKVSADGAMKVAMDAVNALLSDEKVMTEFEMFFMETNSRKRDDIIENKIRQAVTRIWPRYALNKMTIGARR